MSGVTRLSSGSSTETSASQERRARKQVTLPVRAAAQTLRSMLHTHCVERLPVELPLWWQKWS